MPGAELAAPEPPALPPDERNGVDPIVCGAVGVDPVDELVQILICAFDGH
jgi:hypothetical protein